MGQFHSQPRNDDHPRGLPADCMGTKRRQRRRTSSLLHCPRRQRTLVQLRPIRPLSTNQQFVEQAQELCIHGEFGTCSEDLGWSVDRPRCHQYQTGQRQRGDLRLPQRIGGNTLGTRSYRPSQQCLHRSLDRSHTSHLVFAQCVSLRHFGLPPRLTL